VAYQVSKRNYQPSTAIAVYDDIPVISIPELPSSDVMLEDPTMNTTFLCHHIRECGDEIARWMDRFVFLRKLSIR
tara:strand:- start:15 stop:239 length:225 start_codon:yes stop_codon:yes gene_type:complete